jgi:Uma2 family endonuclease
MFATSLDRRRMSFEDFNALPEGVRAEYVDGVAIVNPPSSPPHNEISARLLILLRATLSGLHVGFELGVDLGGRRLRIPDLVVVDRLEEALWTKQVPKLVVEVLSPSTRTEDMLRKVQDYQVAGIGQYWIVDRDERRLIVMVNNGDGWDFMLELTDESPTGEVAVGEFGTVELDLAALLDF